MTLLAGERYRERLEAPLAALGADMLWIPDDPDIDPRLAGHADLSVFISPDGTAFCARGLYDHIVNYLTSGGYTIHPIRRRGRGYPDDAALCVCTVGDYAIYNPKTAAPELSGRLPGKHIHVTQGYTRCSVCVVSDHAIITADDVIARKASQAGMNVLKISPGHIVLEGFDMGFIGGAAFKLNENTLAFTGSLRDHPDREEIFGFLAENDVKPVFLTNAPIFDIGGAITLP